MQRKIGGVRTDAVILIIEMKINKETSGERSLRFLLENEKQNEIKGFFFFNLFCELPEKNNQSYLTIQRSVTLAVQQKYCEIISFQGSQS